MSHRSGSNPKSDRTPRCCASFKVVYYQRWLFDTVDKEFCPITVDFDAKLGPLARHKVGVAFVLLWKFLTQAIPREFRRRDVLHGVIAADLIVRASVGRP